MYTIHIKYLGTCFLNLSIKMYVYTWTTYENCKGICEKHDFYLVLYIIIYLFKYYFEKEIQTLKFLEEYL